jgi:hypothetical protein
MLRSRASMSASGVRSIGWMGPRMNRSGHRPPSTWRLSSHWLGCSAGSRSRRRVAGSGSGAGVPFSRKRGSLSNQGDHAALRTRRPFGRLEPMDNVALFFLNAARYCSWPGESSRSRLPPRPHPGRSGRRTRPGDTAGVHGELSWLGHQISEATVRRILRARCHRPAFCSANKGTGSGASCNGVSPGRSPSTAVVPGYRPAAGEREGRIVLRGSCQDRTTGKSSA